MSGRDLGASVRQRLLNQSRAQGRPFQELLQYFAMERFLYRLSQSTSSDRFVLKGALLLTAWRAPQSRPTMDIDLAGRTSNELGHIAEIVGAVCEVVAEPDGVEFNRDSIEVSRIKEDADYEGVRVRFHATLAKARIPIADRYRLWGRHCSGTNRGRVSNDARFPGSYSPGLSQGDRYRREARSAHQTRSAEQPDEGLL